VELYKLGRKKWGPSNNFWRNQNLKFGFHPERMDISKMRKASDQLQSLPRSTKKIWWTSVH